MSSGGGTRCDQAIKYSSLAVLVIQNTSLVLFMRYISEGSKAPDGTQKKKFINTISVFYGEIFKFVASLLLCCLSHGSTRKGLTDIYNECVHKRKDFAKVLIPACIYTVQNVLLYIAVANLPAATFMVTYQLKILTTALFTVIVLKRKLSREQWIALFFLFAGVAIVQYDQKLSDARQKMEAFHSSSTVAPHNEDELEERVKTLLHQGEDSNYTDFSTAPPIPSSSSLDPLSSTTAPSAKKHEENSLIGFAAVLTACILSGFAGIYFEKILKGSKVSIWVRNFQLAGPSIILALLFSFFKDGELIFVDGFHPVDVFSNMMQGFNWAVWVTVGISALGGLIVAVVIKFADNILKAFATSFAIVVNCVFAYFLFSFRPTMLFVVGACMVIGAVFGYSIYPYKATHKPLSVEEGKETEMEDMKKEKNGKRDGKKTEEELPLDPE